MNEFESHAVFVFVANGVNEFVDALKPVPLDLLKLWLIETKLIECDTPKQAAMKTLHIELVEAFIKAREYVRKTETSNIKNN
jgi:hypothetical protein